MGSQYWIDDETMVRADAESEADRRSDTGSAPSIAPRRSAAPAISRSGGCATFPIAASCWRPTGRFAQGERLDIALSETMLIEARVVWAANGRCGAVFREPIDCPMLLQELAAERRKLGYRAPRLPVVAEATASNEHGAAKVEVFNLSQYGVGFAHDGRFHPGMAVKLKVAGAPERRGVVRWSRDGRAGLFLTEPYPAPTCTASRAGGRRWRRSARRESGVRPRNVCK